jgi:hypothetical protein
MTPARRVKTRTQPCTLEQARKRLADARKFLELAEVVDDESETAALGVSAANAVLAGIAAADAACCRALGERSRGDDHRDAVALVAQVTPGGDDAANALRRLLAVKNDAEYGLAVFSWAKRDLGLRQARQARRVRPGRAGALTRRAYRALVDYAAARDGLLPHWARPTSSRIRYSRGDGVSAGRAGESEPHCAVSESSCR